MNGKTYSMELAGRTLTVELGRLAGQASGSATVRYGDTLVLVTAVMAKQPKEGGDFFPLTCDYEEKFYAAGRISGSRFVKREGKPSDEAILTGRLIDRTIRPRFNGRMRNEVQITATVLSFDGANDPDIPSIIGASVALGISNIPWDGPVAAVRMGRKDARFIVNPTYDERISGDLDIIASGLEDKLNMIEAGSKEVPGSEIAEAFEIAQKEIATLVKFQRDIIQKQGTPKASVPLSLPSEDLMELMHERFASRLEDAYYQKIPKLEKYELLEAIQKEWKEAATAAFGEAVTKNAIEYAYHETENEIVHRRMLEQGDRPDGRKADEVRALSAEAGIIPRVHGSGLFQRGETQVLSIVTLGSPSDEQLWDTMEGEFKQRFMHHYNFPRWSVGEVGRPGGGRREIGHSALAERAIKAVIPPQQEFPYTIRIVSETLSSNGSSSMGSVCGSSLALMDAGVPIKKAVAGIAMGLMLDKEGSYKILTDIQGPEDHHGDMDFKVAGTKDGITALQLDVKIEGVTTKVLQEAMDQAGKARKEILDVMERTIAAPRTELAPLAPRITTLHINPDKIRDLIGPGGKVINEIIDVTTAQVDVEDDGTVYVTAPNREAGEQAVEWIKRVTKEVLPGEILEGVVTRIFNFGAMVEVAPKQEGLVHISELAPWRVNTVEDIVNVGDTVQVKVKEIDSQGRINLSLKDVPGRYSEEDVKAHHALNPQPSQLEYQPRRGGAPTWKREDRRRGPPRRH
ncbi:MAG: polyribonucleotide nucleotidyltransferase [Candidatus Sungbacteria bacterium]|nr:polyribonucleotide nucleotidyltransferase [Candidatus Sungbacteria bacterium]